MPLTTIWLLNWTDQGNFVLQNSTLHLFRSSGWRQAENLTEFMCKNIDTKHSWWLEITNNFAGDKAFFASHKFRSWIFCQPQTFAFWCIATYLLCSVEWFQRIRVLERRQLQELIHLWKRKYFLCYLRLILCKWFFFGTKGCQHDITTGFLKYFLWHQQNN